MKLNSINVVEYSSDYVLGVKSFSTDPEGIKQAEECFKAIIKEQNTDFTDEEMESYVKDGMYEQGDFQVFLSFSMGE